MNESGPMDAPSSLQSSQVLCEAPCRDALGSEVGERMTAAGVSRMLRFEPYRMGSAFLKASARA